MPRAGHWALLRAVTPADYPFIYELGLSGRGLVRWRYRGQTPSPQQFESTLWDGVLAQFIVTSRREDRVGLAVIYAADLNSGHAHLGAILSQEVAPRLWPFEGILLAIDYAFTVWNFRKLYFETAEYNVDNFGSAVEKYLCEESRLVGHDFLMDRYWDRVTYSLWRETWNMNKRRLLK